MDRPLMGGTENTMTIAVLIEPIPGGGFRATGGSPFVESAQGATRDEALDRLRLEIEGRIIAGAVVVPMIVGPEPVNPWLKGAGMFRDNPLFDAWQDAINAYRRSVDQDSEAP